MKTEKTDKTLDELEELAATEARIQIASDPNHPDHELARQRLAAPRITTEMLERIAPTELAAWRDLLRESIKLTEAMVAKSGRRRAPSPAPTGR